jgi:hypothetical protein
MKSGFFSFTALIAMAKAIAAGIYSAIVVTIRRISLGTLFYLYSVKQNQYRSF